MTLEEALEVIDKENANVVLEAGRNGYRCRVYPYVSGKQIVGEGVGDKSEAAIVAAVTKFVELRGLKGR